MFQVIEPHDEVRGPFGREWISVQPLRELLIASGFRPQLCKRGSLSLLWLPYDIMQYKDIYGKDWIYALYDQVSDDLKSRDFLVWIPITPLDLHLKTKYPEGVLLIRYGNDITRVMIV